MTANNTNAIVDGVARVIAGAVSGTIFAAGVTQSALVATPTLVPLADDLSEVGFPIVLCMLGAWSPANQPGNERLTVTVACEVWYPRWPLGENVAALNDARDAIADAFIAHAKLYLTEQFVQSAMVMGGPGVQPREDPNGDATRKFLALPFSVQIKANRSISPQPA